MNYINTYKMAGRPNATIIQIDPDTKKLLGDRAKKLNLSTKQYIEHTLKLLSISIVEPLELINPNK